MSELCCKFQIPACNAVGGVAETRTVLQCDMVKLWMSFKGTLFCNNYLHLNFLNAHVQCIAELLCKFQIPASNTVGEVVVTWTVLQCDMVKRCMRFKVHNSEIMIWIKILFPLCTCSMYVWTILQVSSPSIKYCRKSCGDKNSTTKCCRRTDGRVYGQG